ncbi:MAG TPA: MBL fold metallo-hydrolase [Candidatus Diapherotrites archaeon]|uniref:MBL fold metallo-hydrolase n=1 Tax=Candidatus Iainarchaeum sp. TaxID=3101447 RepID=A0A7J4JI11_9ARCH|nr:MBL fold metallo-hydrolase [Candidatus Diapherotrites archaeon]
MVEQVVGPGVYCVYSTGPSSNSYILAGKKIALIDSGLKENTPNLLNSLKGLGLEPGQVSAVFHTHGHCDHFGGDSLFPDAEVWMHAHDGSLVNARDQDFSAGRYFQGAFFPHVNRYYVESEPLPLRPFNLRLLFSPGHTQGSVCFFEPEKRLLFSGDTLFADAVGRWDLPSGSLVDLQASLRKIRALDFDALLPGHGPLLREPRERQKQAIDERLAELG